MYNKIVVIFHTTFLLFQLHYLVKLKMPLLSFYHYSCYKNMHDDDDDDDEEKKIYIALKSLQVYA